MVVTNGDHQHLSDDEDEIAIVAEEPLLFQDDSHPSQLLQSLNTMRKNKTFCDVILHVSILKSVTTVNDRAKVDIFIATLIILWSGSFSLISRYALVQYTITVVRMYCIMID
jgi:hypothetical protein